MTGGFPSGGAATIAMLAAIAVVAVMTALWAFGRARSNYGVVDLGWAANFTLLAMLLGSTLQGWLPRRVLIGAMVATWSLRLTLHLARRILGHPEEGRYARLRAHWGGPALHAKFLAFFLAQGASYRNTGIVLTITPHIGDRGRIQLEVEQEASDVIATVTSGIDSPTIQQRRIKTTVAVNDGEGIVLGGLIQDRADNVRGQVPLVGQIPVLGTLFKNKDDTISRTELLVAITPRIVKDTTQVRAIAEEFRSRINLTTRPQRQAPPDRREQLDRVLR